MRAGFKTAVLDKVDQSGPSAPKIELLDGTFTNIPVPDASADVIAIAQVSSSTTARFPADWVSTIQAFHWIGDQPEAHQAALAEFARVLKPGGILAVSLECR